MVPWNRKYQTPPQTLVMANETKRQEVGSRASTISSEIDTSISEKNAQLYSSAFESWIGYSCVERAGRLVEQIED
jgi:hypothetical protein